MLKRRISSSFSTNSDTDQSIQKSDTEPAMKEQERHLLPVMQQEGDDDKDERHFYLQKKSRGRPKKKLRVDQTRDTWASSKSSKRPRNDQQICSELKIRKSKWEEIARDKMDSSFKKKKAKNVKGRKLTKTVQELSKRLQIGLHESSSNIDSNDDNNNDSDSESESKSEAESQSGSESASDSNSDSSNNRGSDNSIDSDSDSDGGVADFESESETSEKPRQLKKKFLKARRKPVIDKAFTEVSLKNIIRRRDKVAKDPEAYKFKKVITRSNSRLDYKESSTDKSSDDFDDGNEKRNRPQRRKKNGLQKKKSKKMSSVTKPNHKKETNKKLQKRRGSNANTGPLPIINEKYELSLMTDINVDNLSMDQTDGPWCCDFEPHRSGQVQTDIVALAGSRNVFFLDVQQGRYTKKYIHPEKQEAFRCIAWTTLNIDIEDDSSSDEDEDTCNVLAVAGKLGSIKLLNPLQNECYRYLFGHHETIVRMVFSVFEPRWLFSASADKTVRLWDVGSPISAVDDSICLAKFILPSNVKEPTALNISYDLSTIIVGCSDGSLVRFKLTTDQLNYFRTVIIQNKDENIVTIYPADVYPAGDEWHEGHIDDIYILGQDGDEKSPLYNHTVSRGAEDMEMVVWDLKKSTPNDIEIYKSLIWPESNNHSLLRFKIIEKNGQKALIAGDYEGKIHIFDINDIPSQTLSDNSKEVFDPIRVLSHKASNALIQDISFSTDTRFIIAIDMNNSTFVWKSAG